MEDALAQRELAFVRGGVGVDDGLRDGTTKRNGAADAQQRESAARQFWCPAASGVCLDPSGFAKTSTEHGAEAEWTCGRGCPHAEAADDANDRQPQQDDGEAERNGGGDQIA